MEKNKKKSIPTDTQIVGQATMVSLHFYLAGKASGAGTHGKSGKAANKARRKEGKNQAKGGED